MTASSSSSMGASDGMIFFSPFARSEKQREGITCIDVLLRKKEWGKRKEVSQRINIRMQDGLP